MTYYNIYYNIITQNYPFEQFPTQIEVFGCRYYPGTQVEQVYPLVHVAHPVIQEAHY